MNMIGKLNDDSLIQCYCNHFMGMLQMNEQDLTDTSVEQIIKSILTVDEFKSSISTFIQNAGNDNSSFWHNDDFFKKA